MKPLSAFVDQKAAASTTPSNGRGTAEADAAIREARAGRITMREMLRTVLAAQVFVPLSDPPSVEGNALKSWKPATVTKEAGDPSFLLAFTDIALATSFAQSNLAYCYGLLVDAQWLLSILPPNHGLALNPGGGSSFDWSAAGISAYQAESH